MRRQTFRLATVVAALLTAATVAAQRVEYFWDEDPGIGHGQVLQTFTGSQATIDAELDASSLPPGIHQLGLRTVHGDYYSATYHRTFYVPAPEETISRVEYSWDMEAQPGQGTPLAFSAVGNVVELSQQLSAAKLSPGLHTLYLRTLTEQHYSLTYARQFYVLPVTQEIEAVEYFFDNDPGAGHGHRMVATLTGDELSLVFDISTAGLSYGTHYIGLRTLTGATWSATYYRQFLVRETDAADDEVARIEYFFDNDPGRGLAQDVPFTPNKEVTVDFLADASSLAEGSHKLGLRARSGSGAWSSTVFQQGIVIEPAEDPQEPIDFTKTIEVANSDGVTIYYRFINNNTELEVTYKGDSGNTYMDEYSGDVAIPTSVTLNGNDYPVTSIGSSAFDGCSDLTSVSIPNSVTSIGDYAFEYCSGLTSVNIGNSVMIFGNNVFEGCSGLTTINIPNSVTSIGWRMFNGCRNLTNITIPSSVTTIQDYAFQGCRSLTSVTIPNSVTSIGNHAFRNCSGLTSVTIPNSVTSIGYSAFQYCSGLTGVIIPNSVASIGNATFQGCSGLTSVTIPNSVTSIGNTAFNGCTSLTSVTIPNSVASIGYAAFNGCTGLTSIRVDENNKMYDSRNNCNAIIETSTNSLIAGCNNSLIPNSVTSIGESAFYNCSGLTSINIPNSVTTIGDRAFYGCGSLTSIIIPNSVTSIGSYAFEECSGLTSITIPNSVTTIGNRAFDGCNNITDVYCYAKTLPSVNVDNMFSSISSATLHVPASAIDAYRTTAPWSGFGTIVTIEDEPEDDLQDYLDSFADTEDVLTEATYTRTFNNTQWQAIYVPFMLYNSYWSANFELARLKAFHQYDDNGDGTIDRQELEAEMTTDNLEPNTPYLIRAKNVGTYTVSVKNSWREDETATTTVLSAAHGSLSVTGNYGNLTGLKSDGRYRLQGGALSVPRTDAEVLSSYRWYATLSGQAASRPLTVRFTDGTTAVMAAGGAEVPVVYDLRGRRIDTNNPSLLPKGIYIIDGKKYTVK